MTAEMTSEMTSTRPAPEQAVPLGAAAVTALARAWPEADLSTLAVTAEMRQVLRTVWGRHGFLAHGPRLVSVTRPPLDALARLLLRFGIAGEIADQGDHFSLAVVDRDEQVRFLRDIGVADRDDVCERLLDRLMLERAVDRAAPESGETAFRGFGSVIRPGQPA